MANYSEIKQLRIRVDELEEWKEIVEVEWREIIKEEIRRSPVNSFFEAIIDCVPLVVFGLGFYFLVQLIKWIFN